MDELDERLHAEAAELHARVGAVARTETALRELRAVNDDSRHAPHWMPRIVAVAGLAAAIVVGVVVLSQNDTPQSVTSAIESNPTLTTALATPTSLPTATTIGSDSTVVATTEPTSDATLSTSTPFDRCDYSDPGKFPSNRVCPDDTEVEVTTPVVLGHPLVVGAPSPTMPAAIVGGVVSIADQCVYLIDSFTGASLVIVWPAGTSWDSRRSEIVLPDGQRIVDGATIDGGGGYYSADNVPGVDPSVDTITACLPPGLDSTSPDTVVLAFPEIVTPPTMVVPTTPTS